MLRASARCCELGFRVWVAVSREAFKIEKCLHGIKVRFDPSGGREALEGRESRQIDSVEF